MNGKQHVMMVLMVLICLAAVFMLSAEPAVTNVHASQRTDGSMIVDISYDLAGTGPDGALIIVEVSPDGGATWTIPDIISGAAGNGVMNGNNLEIAWDAGTDQPDEYWLNCLVKISVAEKIILMLPGDIPMELMKISSGSFMMGRYPGEQDSNSDEDPQHEVTIAYDFYLGRYPVTKLQWEAIMETTPWHGQDYVLDEPDSPAVYVSWDDIRGVNGFLDTLNAHLVSTEQPYQVRLPGEAEWEYAARAGTTTRFYWGDDSDHTEIDNYAWYYDNVWDIGNQYAHIVGQKLPNAWGLYDMSGNVWEWCEDDYHSSYHGAPADGSAWVDSPRGSYCVLRGGGWNADAGLCRSAGRRNDSPGLRRSHYGFRALAVRQ